MCCNGVKVGYPKSRRESASLSLRGCGWSKVVGGAKTGKKKAVFF